MDRSSVRAAWGVRLLALAASSAVVAYSGTASAGCGQAAWPTSHAKAGSLTPAVYHPDTPSTSLLVPVSDRGAMPAIVGLWKFEMLAKSTANHANPMPDGTLIDFGTAAWHQDGTEFQTTGSRNPADGDVCQGVWQQVGASTFVLNHYALAWTNGAYTGPVNIRARVTVDPTGQKYSGQFVTVVHLASATAGHEFDESTVLATITGTFTGTRVTMQ